MPAIVSDRPPTALASMNAFLLPRLPAQPGLVWSSAVACSVRADCQQPAGSWVLSTDPRMFVSRQSAEKARCYSTIRRNDSACMFRPHNRHRPHSSEASCSDPEKKRGGGKKPGPSDIVSLCSMFVIHHSFALPLMNNFAVQKRPPFCLLPIIWHPSKMVTMDIRTPQQ